ncbi:MAG: radical SAM protein [Candidatus Omnitrophica bacterium]|nr:radical SAM protein [Candidatus Omnitrophota bacterium]
MLFKKVNPKGIVLVGGVHTSVALDEMIAVEEFDRICQGPGENIIVNLVKDPLAFPRIVSMPGAKSMAEWPIIDRTLWPKPHKRLKNFPWPLEPDIGWAPDPVATILTSRVCPWKCAFCNEDSYISNLGRKPVDRVIDELNYLDETYGPIGSVVIHDSMFFQHPKWLKEWLEKYPRLANHAWPYWASARSDCVRRWPDLFEAIVRETNWTTVSLGFESGSNRILKLLNKECTEEDNYFAIDLLNKIGDDLENMGSTPPKIFANIILAIPGETREDAFKTMRMVKRMHRAISCTAYYSPYPGSALGYQLIAEGKSLLTKYDYQRYPRGKKVQGVDYQFYSDLLAGKYDEEINQMCSKELINEQKIGSFPQPHCMYLFGLKNGKKKLAYGESPQDALDVLRIRLTDKEMEEIIRDEYVVINQCDIQKYVEKLG